MNSPGSTKMISRTIARGICLLRGLLGHSEGAVSVYVAISSLVFLGFAGLAIDLGRLGMLQTELQNAADRTAIAAAGELDGRPNARIRAQRAAVGRDEGGGVITPQLTDSQQLFGKLGVGDTDLMVRGNRYTIRFLRSLPADSASVNTTDDCATRTSSSTSNLACTDGEARFAYLQITPYDMDIILFQLLRGLGAAAPLQVAAQAEAVAGLTQAVCKMPPLMMCNPADTAGSALGDPFSMVPGQMVRLKSNGGGSAWAPGVFGLLCPPDGNCGGANVADHLATSTPNACYSGAVEIKTGGTTGPYKAAANTRFDMYDPPQFNNEWNDPNYRPARHVIKGTYAQGANWISYLEVALAAGATGLGGYSAQDIANWNVPPSAWPQGFDNTRASYQANPNRRAKGAPFPRDNCFYTNSCTGSSSRISEGAQANNWDRAAYWALNHPGQTWPPAGWGAGSSAETALGPAATATRHDVYRYEKDFMGTSPNFGIPYNSPPCPGGGTNEASCNDGENGRPTNSNQTPNDTPDRRVLIVAIINCTDEGVTGGSNPPMLPQAFAKFFMNEPVRDDPADFTLWAEFIDVVRPGNDDGVLRDMVQLYR
jgi:Putative Flp pilus-assembly TadE/G-like